MSDDQISVELNAKIDGLTSGLTEAVNAMREAVEAIKGDTKELVDDSKEQGELLKGIFNAEMFQAWVEGAKLAFEAVKGGLEAIEGTFEATVGAYEELGISTAKTSSLLGVSGEEAAGLAAALTNVGSSTDAYESMALRLQHTLESSTTITDELKGKFTDANGEFLTGADLMDRLQTVTSSYTDTAERNAVLTELLGRRAKDYFDIARVTGEAVKENTEIYESFGVALNDGGASSIKLEDATGLLNTTWKAFEAELGQQFTPIATELFTLLRDVGTPVLKALGEVTKVIALAFEGLVLVVDELVESCKLAFTAIVDFASGNWGKLESDFGEAGEKMKAKAEEVGKALAKLLYPDSGEGGEKSKGDVSTWGRGLAGEDLGVPGWGKSPDTKKGPKDNSADEAIQSEKAIALEKISVEESTNQHLLAMGAESVDQFIAQARNLENETYAVKVDALNKELALPGRTKAEQQKTNDEIAQAFEVHVGNLVKIAEDGASRRSALAKKVLADELKADDERLSEGKAKLNELAAEGQITALDRDAQEKALTLSIRGEELARIQTEMAGLDKQSQAYEDLVKQKQKLEKQLTKEIEAENAQRLKDTKALVTEGIAPLAAGFHTAISDMMSGSKSFAQTMQDVAKSIEQGFISLCEKMIEEWAIKEITNALLTQSTQAASGLAQVESQAAIAGAAAFASTAAIPIGGLAAAPAAAGAAYAEVMASFAGPASAAGGMLLDQDQLVFAHKGEQILPAHLSAGMQNIINNGGSGGPVNLHYSPVINGGQNATLEQMLRDQGSALMAFIAQKSRDGAFGRAR